MPFGRHPITVNGFVMHHQEKRFILILAPTHPVFTILSDEVSYISFMPSGISLGNKIRIIIISLIIQNHPMVKPGRLWNKMPLADNGCFITVCLQYLRQCLLRTVKSFISIPHKTILMTMLTSQYGCTTGTGNGIATVIILKYRPFMPNTVNMGSRSYFTYGMSIYTHCLSGMVITHDKNNVRTPVSYSLFLFLSLHPNRRNKGQQGNSPG